jgi:hypothetical protein
MSWAAVAKIGGSLLGGLFGRSREKRNEYLNSPLGIKTEALKAGMNPLWFVGSAGSFGSGGYGSAMGSAIADAGLAYADHLTAKSALKLQNQKLQEQNEDLRKRFQDYTLRPTVGGIYSGRSSGSGRGSQSSGLDRDNSGSSLLGVSGGVVDGDPYGVPYVRRESPRIKFFGANIEGSGRFSSAQTVEDSYGEAVGLAHGILGFADAIGHSVRGRVQDARLSRSYRRMLNDFGGSWEALSDPSKRKEPKRYDSPSSWEYLSPFGVPSFNF